MERQRKVTTVIRRREDDNVTGRGGRNDNGFTHEDRPSVSIREKRRRGGGAKGQTWDRITAEMIAEGIPLGMGAGHWRGQFRPVGPCGR